MKDVPKTTGAKILKLSMMVLIVCVEVMQYNFLERRGSNHSTASRCTKGPKLGKNRNRERERERIRSPPGPQTTRFALDPCTAARVDSDG